MLRSHKAGSQGNRIDVSGFACLVTFPNSSRMKEQISTSSDWALNSLPSVDCEDAILDAQSVLILTEVANMLTKGEESVVVSVAAPFSLLASS